MLGFLNASPCSAFHQHSLPLLSPKVSKIHQFSSPSNKNKVFGPTLNPILAIDVCISFPFISRLLEKNNLKTKSHLSLLFFFYILPLSTLTLKLLGPLAVKPNTFLRRLIRRFCSLTWLMTLFLKLSASPTLGPHPSYRAPSFFISVTQFSPSASPHTSLSTLLPQFCCQPYFRLTSNRFQQVAHLLHLNTLFEVQLT